MQKWILGLSAVAFSLMTQPTVAQQFTAQDGIQLAHGTPSKSTTKSSGKAAKGAQKKAKPAAGKTAATRPS